MSTKSKLNAYNISPRRTISSIMNKYCHEERFRYLKELVAEFQTTGCCESKEQILANLGNFAYDPINYDHFRKLNILKLFLEQMNSSSQNIVEYALGGICNSALDPENRKYILENGGLNQVLCCLSSPREETLLTAITCLMFLHTPESRIELTSSTVTDFMKKFQQNSNPRLSNLATIFLQDYCHENCV